MSKELKLGGHLKASEGLSLVLAAARGLRYNEIQIMLAEGRSYVPWEFSEAVCREFQKMSYDITVTVHLPYTINPCESMKNRRNYYGRAARAFIETGLALGAKRFVIHPGFKKDLSETEAKKNLLTFLEEIWSESHPALLLLETDSGSKNGSAIGSAEFLEEALAESDFTNLGMCLDTTHIYARGTDLYNPIIRKEFLERFGHLIKLVHLNSPDPEVSLGSFLDRHNTTFKSRKDLDAEGMIKDLAHYPMILERRSIQVQSEDNIYVRQILGQPFEKQKA